MASAARRSWFYLVGAGTALFLTTCLATYCWVGFSIPKRHVASPTSPGAEHRATRSHVEQGRRGTGGRSPHISPERKALRALERVGSGRLARTQRDADGSGRYLTTAAAVAARVGPDIAIPLPSLSHSAPLRSVVREPSRGTGSHGRTIDPMNEELRYEIPRPFLQLTDPRWPTPECLLGQLRSLRRSAPSRQVADWCTASIDTLDQFTSRSVRTATPETRKLFDRLAELVQDGYHLADRTAVAARGDLLRAVYALERRVMVWRGVDRVLHPTAVRARVDDGASELQDVLDRVGAALDESAQGASWRRYLLIEAVAKANDDVLVGGLEERSRLARTVLSRMHSPLLNEDQEQFLAAGPFRELDRRLRRWVVEPVDWPRLIESIEFYERYRSSDEARAIARATHIARWSADDAIRRLGETMEDHYRNANARVALSVELLNLMLPQPPETEASVDDTLRGTRIMGRSHITSQLRLFLIPDRRRWRFGLEVEGDVASETEATNGPARFFHHGRSRYRAEKHLQLDRRGLRIFGARADADLDSELVGVETDFDGVPLLGSIARALAVSQHDREAAESQHLMRRRLESRIEQQLDDEIHDQLVKARDQFKKRFHQPLRKLQLNPTPIELQTTEQRMIVRYRIAAHHQLGSHTPRPRAPGNAWLSLQVHESALNNVLEQLHLDGRTIELKELYREVSTLFGREATSVPEEIPDGVILRFAPRDAVRLQFNQGTVTVFLALDTLAYEQHKWRQFVVRAVYRPAADGLDPTFVRDGYVRLKGRRLKLRDQVVLRGIFSAVFSKQTPIHLFGDKLAGDRRFQSLHISQYIVHDGWVGIALSPSGQPRSAKRREPLSEGRPATRRR